MISRMARTCPLCKEEHETFTRLADLPTVACSRLAAGEARFFPTDAVCVLGAGDGVERKAKEAQTDADVRAEIARLEAEANRKKSEENIAAQREADRKRLAELSRSQS